MRIVPGNLNLCTLVLVLLLIAPNLYGQGIESNRKTESGPDIDQPAATIVINEKFFNALLEAIFSQLRAPRYPLKIAATDVKGESGSSNQRVALRSNDCDNWIQLEKEVDGVKSAFNLKSGFIEAPLAFRGNYDVAFVGCVEFRGWAETRLAVYFDEGKQSLGGRLSVEDIHLSGMPSRASVALMPMVQSALDRKINPIEILQASQLSTRLPISAAGGSLQMRPKSITPEIVPGELRLRVVYGFSKE
jgi:hypothetical protein